MFDTLHVVSAEGRSRAGIALGSAKRAVSVEARVLSGDIILTAGHTDGVSEQLGKHNASGPVARGPDGSIDPEGYLRARLGDRTVLVVHAFFMLSYALVLALRFTGSVTGALLSLAVIVVLDVVLVGGVRLGRTLAERSRRRSGQPPSWSAMLLATLQAREMGFELDASISNDAELRGRVCDHGDCWVWRARTGRRRRAAALITLDDREWAARLRPDPGYRRILTFTTSGGKQLDFRISAGRDLRSHLRARPS